MVTDRRGRTLWTGPVRPGRMRDQTAVKTEGLSEKVAAWDAARHQQSSERICAEHANAEHKHWRTLQWYASQAPRFHLGRDGTVFAAVVTVSMVLTWGQGPADGYRRALVARH
ncbi:hypothetical protein ACFYM2_25005 [Streptomyces sp. NPDC006711]|uniref:hypothetical protein n=1 Tax=Streptomyces sp. NPDC006711 TaxID=3364762 RepID=UPI0036A38CC4